MLRRLHVYYWFLEAPDVFLNTLTFMKLVAGMWGAVENDCVCCVAGKVMVSMLISALRIFGRISAIVIRWRILLRELCRSHLYLQMTRRHARLLRLLYLAIFVRGKLRLNGILKMCDFVVLIHFKPFYYEIPITYEMFYYYLLPFYVRLLTDLEGISLESFWCVVQNCARAN